MVPFHICDLLLDFSFIFLLWFLLELLHFILITCFVVHWRWATIAICGTCVVGVLCSNFLKDFYNLFSCHFAMCFHLDIDYEFFFVLLELYVLIFYLGFWETISEIFLALWLSVLTWKFGNKCCLVDCMLNWVMMKVRRTFYYYHYLLMASQKLWDITMVVVNLNVFLDIFCYSTIGYLKILYLQIFYYNRLFHVRLFQVIIFLVFLGYFSLFHFILFYIKLFSTI